MLAIKYVTVTVAGISLVRVAARKLTSAEKTQLASVLENHVWLLRIESMHGLYSTCIHIAAVPTNERMHVFIVSEQ